MLIELTSNLRYDDMREQFETALTHEEEHLQNVRDWVSDCVMDKAQVEGE